MRIGPTSGGYYSHLDGGIGEYDRRVLVSAGRTYRDLDEVADAHPQFGRTGSAVVFFEAWLRLHHGSGYRIIRDANEFRRRYEAFAGRGRKALSTSQANPAYAIYDVTEVREPELRNDVLRCYVEDRRCGIPYRVDLPWPTNMEATVEFRLLSVRDGRDDDYI